jgi:hypothetical protein
MDQHVIQLLRAIYIIYGGPSGSLPMRQSTRKRQMSKSFGGILTSKWPQMSLEKPGMMLHSAAWENIWTAAVDDLK